MNKEYLKIETNSNLENLTSIRLAVISFLEKYNIYIDELMDIKTALSEAVTNAIDHAYENEDGRVIITVEYVDSLVKINIQDFGKGIENIELAMTPCYTTKPEDEHAGMGFTIMESFMDEIIVDSSVDSGTQVFMSKRIKIKRSSVEGE